MLKLNLLVITYIFITTAIIASSNIKLKNRQAYYLVSFLIVLCEAVPFFMPLQSRFLQVFYDWSPLIFLPYLHRITGLLTSAFKQIAYDNQFIQFENKYFSYVMDFHQQNRLNNKSISEFLHICYLSFYILIYGVPLYFYLQHDFLAFYQSTFAILLLLFSCFLTHGIVPVYGPRNIFDKIADHRSEGFFFRLVHKILAAGSTDGTAFPSGHTGVACVILFTTAYLQAPVFYYIFPFAVGLVISTIYGRFHYVVDAIFGLLYALIAFLVAVWLM